VGLGDTFCIPALRIRLGLRKSSIQAGMSRRQGGIGSSRLLVRVVVEPASFPQDYTGMPFPTT
jgi:hypothetical protein